VASFVTRRGPPGRGRRYSRLRGLVESALSAAYSGDWPARLRGAFGSTRVDLARHTLAILPPGMPALRLAFASDLHLGPTTPPAVLDEALRLLAGCRPDVLVLGGDYVFLEATARRLADLEEWVARVPAPVKLAVMGNHDLWADDVAIAAALERGGARVLVNDAVRLPGAHGGLAVVGLDDPWTGVLDVERGFAAAGDAEARLVVCHAPEVIPHLPGRGPALLVCGHTHGGQVALPWGPVVVHGRYGRRYPAGRYRVDDYDLVVSRGLGVVEVPLRLYAPPDVVVLDLVERPRARELA
jgi:hypothetical protein